MCACSAGKSLSQLNVVVPACQVMLHVICIYSYLIADRRRLYTRNLVYRISWHVEWMGVCSSRGWN